MANTKSHIASDNSIAVAAAVDGNNMSEGICVDRVIEEVEDVEEEQEASSGGAYERETVINFNNAEKGATYYTLNYNKRQMLLRLAEEYPDEVQIVAQRDDMVEAILPKSWIKVRPPRKMTEEERQKLVERGKTLAARATEKRKQEAGK